MEEEQLQEALELIRLDLIDNPGRARASVVMSAIGWKDDYFGGRTTYEQVKDAFDLQEKFGQGYRDIMDLGVPIVVAAGNEGNGDSPTPIDFLPQLLTDHDTPLIVVGAAANDGLRDPYSQVGNQLTIYGPGSNSPMQSKENGGHFIAGGTSLGKYFMCNVGLLKCTDGT